jgi:hypothetical protein
MRRPSTVTLGRLVIALAGCTSPRERDCTALLPLADRARAATWTETARDAGLAVDVSPELGESARRVATSLREIPTRDPATKAPSVAVADATARFAGALDNGQRILGALKIPPRELQALVSDGRTDALAEDVARVMEHCGLLVGSEAARARPECIAFDRALTMCTTPRTDDVTVEEQLLDCASAVESVRAGDAAVASAFRHFGEAMRRAEPLARSVGVPAREALRLAREGTLAAVELSAAQKAITRADADLRAVCKARR